MSQPSQPPKNNTLRILSLSGGGVRGIYQVAYLSNIERNLGIKIHDCFDIISGTSTGALTALAVAYNIDLHRILDLFRTRAQSIFRPRRFSIYRRGARYSSTLLKSILTDIFDNRQLSDCEKTVVLTAASLERLKPAVFSNIGGNETVRDISVVDAALATAAAPTYFTPITPAGRSRAYVDGGVWANSPAALTALMAYTSMNVDFSNMRLLAIGTGDFQQGYTEKTFNKMYPISRSSIGAVFELMLSTQQFFSARLVLQLLPDGAVMCINPNIPRLISLDDVPSALEQLPPLAESDAHESVVRFKELFVEMPPAQVSEMVFKKVRGRNLATAEMIRATGLSCFVPERKYYNVFRDYANDTDEYIKRARSSITMISINLMTGMPHHGIWTVIREKLENHNQNFRAVISLLDPNTRHLMEAIAPVFDESAEELSRKISSTLAKLVHNWESLTTEARERLDVRVHKAIPFGSAIVIDHEQPRRARIQIETKSYKEPFKHSFAFEIVPTGQDGLFESLIRGFTRLIEEGESLVDADKQQSSGRVLPSK